MMVGFSITLGAEIGLTHWIRKNEGGGFVICTYSSFLAIRSSDALAGEQNEKNSKHQRDKDNYAP